MVLCEYFKRPRLPPLVAPCNVYLLISASVLPWSERVSESI